MNTHREPFWGPGNPRRLRSLTPTEQRAVWKSDRLAIKEALWFVVLAVLVVLVVGYPLGLFALFH
jgi:hypothetical protein